MNIAEAIVVKHTSGQRQKCIDDVKFKLLGGDKFESKNDFIENSIDSLLKHFSSAKTVDKK